MIKITFVEQNVTVPNFDTMFVAKVTHFPIFELIKFNLQNADTKPTNKFHKKIYNELK